MTSFELVCVRDGNIQHFQGNHDDSSSEIRFILEDEGHNQQTDGYIIDFIIQHIDNEAIQITHMCIDIERYLGIGIPEALILKAKELFGKQIISSTNSRKDGEVNSNESISKKAIKVWKRLVCRKLAYYDSETDRYKTFPPQK